MQNHVFISYAHIDDQPLPISKKGWVTNFDETLKNLLSQKIGEQAFVWRDTRMNRNAVFDNEIIDNLLESLTFVSIVTPRYVKSEYCLQELDKFCEEVEPVGNNSRVFKVVKTFVELEKMPEVFRRINGFDFFEMDERSNIPREFSLDFGNEWAANFLLKTSDLAYEIAQTLNLIGENIEYSPAPEKIVPKVYLAKTSAEFQKDFDNIRRDLTDRGYEVLPAIDVIYPTTVDKYRNLVRENLEKCDLSIHLIGKNYGERPEDGEQSYIHLQTIVSEQVAQNQNLKRIVWIPKDVNLDNQAHKQFIDEIWASTKNGVDVFEKPLEDLKTNILDALELVRVNDWQRKNKTGASKTLNKKPSILVLYDKTDSESTALIENRFKEKGFSVWSAAKYFSDESSVLIEAQNEYLRYCDAVLIYWKNAPDFWVRITLQRLQKIFGDGREEPFLGEAVFSDGDISQNDIADESEVEFLNNLGQLDNFLEQVKNSFKSKSVNGGQMK